MFTTLFSAIVNSITPAIAAGAASIVTALLAFVKRWLDLRAINKKNAQKIIDVIDRYDSQLSAMAGDNEKLKQQLKETRDRLKQFGV